MLRRRRLLTAFGAVLSSTILLSGCGGPGSGTVAEGSTETGEPVSGGTLRVIQTGEPRSLDPASLMNTWSHQPVLGNALYGTLMVNDIDTFDIEYTMAEDFSTVDGGATFILTLQPGLTFTDGTPLDAATVKFNWDRLRDPTLGSLSTRWASAIAETEVVDPTTLKVVMTTPNPHFAQAIVSGGLNWIASPEALQKGPASFDENPVGAGPFVLTNWTRQDTIELERNPDFWDAPKPYLDRLTIRTVADTNQRLNTITTDGADLASESNWANLKKAEAAGYSYEVAPTGGGQYIGMNFRRAPFDDQRARRAVALAVDPDAINAAVYNGEGKVPQTLFEEGSPFFSDIALGPTDHAAAQELFDELAAEGKPVTFTFMSYPTTESRTVAEALQAQLSVFDNVEAAVEVVDYSTATARAVNHDFDMFISGVVIQDPDIPLWSELHSDSSGNFMGIDDADLSAALDAGRIATSVEDRRAAYETVQERLAELTPGVWYYRAAPAVVSNGHVHGVSLYGLGSVLPEELWLTE